LLNRGEQTLRAVTGSGGRLHPGMVAGIKSERRPTSNRNPRPDCLGIRTPSRVGRVTSRASDILIHQPHYIGGEDFEEDRIRDEVLVYGATYAMQLFGATELLRRGAPAKCARPGAVSASPSSPKNARPPDSSHLASIRLEAPKAKRGGSKACPAG
jgi:hypothetical protein